MNAVRTQPLRGEFVAVGLVNLMIEKEYQLTGLKLGVLIRPGSAELLLMCHVCVNSCPANGKGVSMLCRSGVGGGRRRRGGGRCGMESRLVSEGSLSGTEMSDGIRMSVQQCLDLREKLGPFALRWQALEAANDFLVQAFNCAVALWAVGRDSAALDTPS